MMEKASQPGKCESRNGRIAQVSDYGDFFGLYILLYDCFY